MVTASHPHSGGVSDRPDAPGLRVQRIEGVFATIADLADALPTPCRNGEHCLDYVTRLRLGPTPEEAITAMAFALSPRHAIWWGHEAIKVTADLVTDQDRAMLSLCAAWVADPVEARRRACMDAGAKTTPRGPGVWLAMAAGWNSGSMAPPDLPPVLVPESLLGRALNAAVLTALARVPQDKRRRMLDHYVSMAEVLASQP